MKICLVARWNVPFDVRQDTLPLFFTISSVFPSEICKFENQYFPAWLVTALVSLSNTLNHNCFILWMGRKAVGLVCCVMHVKEPRTLIVKEKGLAPVFLDSRLEHPAGWICARYKCSVLLLLLYYYIKDKQIL